jgi:hypothetical protein
MENKKQSSIDFIFNAFNLLSDSDFKAWMLNNHGVIKAMHKEEIQTSHECGQQSEKDYNRNGDKIGCRFIEKSEQYYNETFGGENE